jgi:hypothetical protein
VISEGAVTLDKAVTFERNRRAAQIETSVILETSNDIGDLKLKEMVILERAVTLEESETIVS